MVTHYAKLLGYVFRGGLPGPGRSHAARGPGLAAPGEPAGGTDRRRVPRVPPRHLQAPAPAPQGEAGGRAAAGAPPLLSAQSRAAQGGSRLARALSRLLAAQSGELEDVRGVPTSPGGRSTSW